MNSRILITASSDDRLLEKSASPAGSRKSETLQTSTPTVDSPGMKGTWRKTMKVPSAFGAK